MVKGDTVGASREAGAGTNEGRERLPRRGMIAGAAALIVGMLAKQASDVQPVAADNGNFLRLGERYINYSGGDTNNQYASATGVQFTGTTNSSTLIVSDTGTFTGLDFPAVLAANHQRADGLAAAFYANTNQPYGIGVVGQTIGDPNSIGLRGLSDIGTGVFGSTGGLYGVYGSSTQSGGIGVSGNCTGGYGVLGTVSDGYGVLGQAVTGNGLFGFSQQNHAVVGQTARPYFGGVFGLATLANTVGIYGSTISAGGGNVASAYAGYMDGNFVAVHGFKSAAVPHHDGSYRLVYCMESPECWFEDFGTGTLANGTAEITLDPDFAAIVHTDDYHVFLTAHSEHSLYVARRSATGFTVQAAAASGVATSKAIAAVGATFSYRVVAKRKDIKAERLATFDLPKQQQATTQHLQKPSLPTFPHATPSTNRDNK